MTLVLELPAELENQLREAANKRGLNVSEFVLEAARERAEFQLLVAHDPEAAIDQTLEMLDVQGVEHLDTGRDSIYRD